MHTVANTAIFKIIDAKMYVPVVTLSTEDSVKLSKLLREGFNRSIYWNEYKVIDNRVVAIAAANEEKHIRELLNPSCNGVKRFLFLLMPIRQLITKFLIIRTKNISFQDL